MKATITTSKRERRTSELVLDPPRQKRAPLAVELLVSPDSRRDRLSVEAHEVFRESITTPRPASFDEIDELVEGLRSLNFEERGAAL